MAGTSVGRPTALDLRQRPAPTSMSHVSALQDVHHVRLFVMVMATLTIQEIYNFIKQIILNIEKYKNFI